MKNEVFTKKGLEEHVLREAGILRTGPARTIRDWLEDMKECGYVKEIRPGVYTRQKIKF